jgi:hypothetical protein
MITKRTQTKHNAPILKHQLYCHEQTTARAHQESEAFSEADAKTQNQNQKKTKSHGEHTLVKGPRMTLPWKFPVISFTM